MTLISAPAALSPAAARRVFYTVTVTRWFPIGVVVGLFILLQTPRGRSAAQALTPTAAIGLVAFGLELPTSRLADALGRRPVYAPVASWLADATSTGTAATVAAAFPPPRVRNNVVTRLLSPGPRSGLRQNSCHNVLLGTGPRCARQGGRPAAW